MHVVAQKDLPFHGMSHEFVGADQGHVADIHLSERFIQENLD